MDKILRAILRLLLLHAGVGMVPQGGDETDTRPEYGNMAGGLPVFR